MDSMDKWGNIQKWINPWTILLIKISRRQRKVKENSETEAVTKCYAIKKSPGPNMLYT